MKKIPVGATIAHAYRFVFSNVVAIAGLTWAPLLLQMVLAAIMFERLTRIMASMLANDPSAFSQIGPLLLLYPIGGILTFIQFTSVSEFALGIRKPAAFSFPIGKPVWRLIGGFLLLLLALIALTIMYILAAFILGLLLKLGLGAMSTTLTRIVTALSAVLAMLVGYCGFIYIAFRLGFLLAPATLIMQRIELREAWRLAKGNFWRIFVICLALLAPVMIIEYSLMIAAVGLPPTLPSGPSKEAIQALAQAKLNWNLALFSIMSMRWYITCPLAALLAIFMYGSGCAAQAYAYRALTEEGSIPVAAD